MQPPLVDPRWVLIDPLRGRVGAFACPWLVWAIVIAAGSSSATAVEPSRPDFGRDIRPILSNRCFRCHGPDESRREAGLRLDNREEAIAELASGVRAIVPGRSTESELVARITSQDPGTRMPPPHAKTPLTDDERRLLTEWIEDGAAYAPHWAFVRPVKAAIPLPSSTPQGWIGNPIDAFVLARLESEGLSPSPEADRATLCRRVHLDLVGLPPSPAELQAFLADASPDSYERLVERLLASPRYGERWARRWLDLARYADTNGYEKDRERSIWPWRDWVIRAINDDMPFDAFTIRQIAGDMLPGGTSDDILATGFHRNTMLNEEGGIDPLEFRYLAMVDRVGTTGATWLGLTTACAQCHSHKFDPITQVDYFGLMACLDNADEPDWIIPGADHERRLADVMRQIEEAWKALPAAWPPRPAATLQSSEDAAERSQAEPSTPWHPLEERFVAWQREESVRAVRWAVAQPTQLTTSMPFLSVREDGSILAGGDSTKSDVYAITIAPSDRPIAAVRLEVLPDESLPAHGPGLCSYEGPKGDFFLSELEITADGRPVSIARATDSFGGQAFAGGKGSAAATIDGEMSSGWTTNGDQGRPHAAVYQLAQPVAAGVSLVITMRFERHYACPLGCFRLSVSDDGHAEARGLTATVEASLAKPETDRSDEEREAVRRSFLALAPELAEPMKKVRGLEARLRDGTHSLVLRERPAGNPRGTVRRHRGEYTQPREEVRAAVPAFLPQFPKDVRADRMALARWLVSQDNPLTARVVVNRDWQAFFGRGIVPTLDDFGYQGEPPSHPELLDWLAVEFMQEMAWSRKRLHRVIVTSGVYRQASRASAAMIARDPTNILLARGARVRLESEIIRDSLLSAAGLLSERMYGPGVRPPQPEGVTEVAYGAPKWRASDGEDRHRRSIYTFQKRTAPFAFTTTFDGPSGEACLARRDVSNSALQALTLLNDPMFLEVARSLGAAAQAAGGDDAGRLDALGLRVLSRPFAEDERAELSRYLTVQRARLSSGELDAVKLCGGEGANVGERAAWMLVARAVMNLDEVVVKR